MSAISSLASAAAELMRSHILPTILGGAILASLTFGGSYILFQEKPGLQKISDKGKTHSDILDSRLKSAEKMDRISADSWFDADNAKKIGNIISELVKDRAKAYPSIRPCSVTI